VDARHRCRGSVVDRTRVRLIDESRTATAQLLVVAGATLLIAYAAIAGPAAVHLAPAAALVAVAAVFHRKLFAWPALLTGLLLIILIIPIRRYRVPFNLPFQLEPYRIYVLLIVALWFVALMIDQRVRLRSSGLDPPILLIVLTLATSVAANADRVTEYALGSEVLKQLTFTLTFFFIYYLIVSVVHTAEDAELPIRVLVLGGAVLGVLGIIETKVNFNPFDHLDKVLPFLTPDEDNLADTTFRAGLTRAYGSAQHPIAFGAALTILIPPALYLAYRRKGKIWWLASLLILLGSLTAVSRTTVVMLVVAGIVIVLLRPAAVLQHWKLAIPALIIIQLALPGTLATIKASFFPQGGLVAQQANASVGSGRVASLGPALEQVGKEPLLGIGFGTRIVAGPDKNSFILDDQWLGILLETGVLGVVGWAWLFVRFTRRAGRAARHDDDDRGWLLAALAASVASFAVGMFFYDALSFIQVTIIMFVLLGIGSGLMAGEPKTAATRVP
jgi:polysaccharide biosynthesis protein PslJ